MPCQLTAMTARVMCKLVSGMHALHNEFLMKPEESVGCHQTLSSWVGSGHETNALGEMLGVAIPMHPTSTPTKVRSMHT